MEEPEGSDRPLERPLQPGDSYLHGGRAAEALAVNRLRLTDILAAPSAQVVASEFREHLDGIRGVSGRELEIRSFNRPFGEPFLSAARGGSPPDRGAPARC